MKKTILTLALVTAAPGCTVNTNAPDVVADRELLTLVRPDLITRVTAESISVSPNGRATATAECPVGYVAISGGHGFTVQGLDGAVTSLDFSLWRSIPFRIGSGTYNQWRTSGHLDGPFNTWRLWVTATCYRWQPDPLEVNIGDIEIPELELSQ
ncbi:MAG: hypothetical protein AAGA41_01280 [Pseudomonadota bacterium]